MITISSLKAFSFRFGPAGVAGFLLFLVQSLGAQTQTAGPDAAPASPASAARPNIILITADDMGMTPGAFGKHDLATPNLDRLAAEGVLFRNAYVTQASCSPSRASMLTGLYPHQNGQMGLVEGYAVKPEITATLPKLLGDAGYATAILGKLHIRPATSFPFQDDHSNLISKTRDVKMVNDLFKDFLANRGGKPFFAMINFFDPHRPYNDQMNQTAGLPTTLITPDQATPFSFLDTDFPFLRQQMAYYYNACTRVDIGVGLTLDTLKEQGLDQNTLIFFLSDNGPPFPRAKTGSYEASIHTPMMMAWPAKGGGRQVTQLISSVDIMPTALAAAGVSAPAGLPGMSLIPFFTGDPATWRTEVFTEQNSHAPGQFYPRRTVRDARYKLIHNLTPEYKNPVFSADQAFPPDMKSDHYPDLYQRWEHPPDYELYDLQNDPDEFVNLIDDPSLQGVAEKLKGDLAQWQKDTADPLTTPAAIAAARAYDFSTRKKKGAGGGEEGDTSDGRTFQVEKTGGDTPAP